MMICALSSKANLRGKEVVLLVFFILMATSFGLFF
jgi:hypothetical protein